MADNDTTSRRDHLVAHFVDDDDDGEPTDDMEEEEDDATTPPTSFPVCGPRQRFGLPTSVVRVLRRMSPHVDRLSWTVHENERTVSVKLNWDLVVVDQPRGRHHRSPSAAAAAAQLPVAAGGRETVERRDDGVGEGAVRRDVHRSSSTDSVQRRPSTHLAADHHNTTFNYRGEQQHKDSLWTRIRRSFMSTSASLAGRAQPPVAGQRSISTSGMAAVVAAAMDDNRCRRRSHRQLSTSGNSTLAAAALTSSSSSSRDTTTSGPPSASAGSGAAEISWVHGAGRARTAREMWRRSVERGRGVVDAPSGNQYHYHNRPQDSSVVSPGSAVNTSESFGSSRAASTRRRRLHSSNSLPERSSARPLLGQQQDINNSRCSSVARRRQSLNTGVKVVFFC